MIRHQIEIEHEENPFALSIGDLMAALLLIFVLLLTTTLLMLQEKFEKDKNLAEQYAAVKENLYKQLYVEFKEDLVKWNAELDPKELSIRFKEPKVLFEYDKYTLKEGFKDIIDDFFPRYIKVLTIPEFKDTIEEIRIEGHTDSDGGYFYNMKLSQDRTRSVLEYSLSVLQDNAKKGWVKNLLTANGLSYSKLIYNPDNTENQEASRRVEFKVRTNAEEQIKKMLRIP